MSKQQNYICYAPITTLGEDFSIGESGYEKCEPKHFWGPGERNYYLYHYIESGKGKLTINGKTYEVGPNQMFYIGTSDYSIYQADETDPWTYYWISFNGAKAKALTEKLRFDADHPVADLTPKQCKEVKELLRNIYYYTLKSEYKAVTALGRLYLFFEWMLNNFGKPQPTKRADSAQYFFSTLHYIVNNLNSDVSIGRLSRRLGYDRTNLYKIFKKKIDMSPIEFIEQYRIFRACKLIEEGKLSLEKTATAVGFNTYPWFSKVFRKVAGLTPSEFAASENKVAVLDSYNFSAVREVLAEYAELLSASVDMY